jgi:glycosyltransferase involved in cell wall biosynthesis
LTKLIIQIPCYNEERTLGTTIEHLPRCLPGVDEIEWLVINDGSTDRTVAVAETCGVDYVINHQRNRGLAHAFISGLDACLEHGADIIVNLDADNQYCAEYIGALIQPILNGSAEMVIGARPIDTMDGFSRIKKILQKFGSWIVRQASDTDIPDAPSGFRAFSREAAMHMRVYSQYTYTLETIIQAGQRGLAITSVPVRTNPASRPSRLIRSIPSYLLHSATTVVRIFVVYRPFRFFFSLGMVLLLLGTGIGARFLWYYMIGKGQGHIQSLILASILIGIAFQTIMVAFIADLLSVNRRLCEDIRFRLKQSIHPPHHDSADSSMKEYVEGFHNPYAGGFVKKCSPDSENSNRR